MKDKVDLPREFDFWVTCRGSSQAILMRLRDLNLDFQSTRPKVQHKDKDERKS